MATTKKTLRCKVCHDKGFVRIGEGFRVNPCPGCNPDSGYAAGEWASRNATLTNRCNYATGGGGRTCYLMHGHEGNHVFECGEFPMATKDRCPNPDCGSENRAERGCTAPECGMDQSHRTHTDCTDPWHEGRSLEDCGAGPNWPLFSKERDRLPEDERENFTADVISQIDNADFRRVIERNVAIYAEDYPILPDGHEGRSSLQPEKTARQKVYAFMGLPSHRRWERANKLGLVEPADDAENDTDLMVMWCARAKAKGCVDELLLGASEGAPLPAPSIDKETADKINSHLSPLPLDQWPSTPCATCESNHNAGMHCVECGRPEPLPASFIGPIRLDTNRLGHIFIDQEDKESPFGTRVILTPEQAQEVVQFIQKQTRAEVGDSVAQKEEPK